MSSGLYKGRQAWFECCAYEVMSNTAEPTPMAALSAETANSATTMTQITTAAGQRRDARKPPLAFIVVVEVSSSQKKITIIAAAMCIGKDIE